MIDFQESNGTASSENERVESPKVESKPDAEAFTEDEDMVQQCIEVIRTEQKASVSLLQRRLRLGYTRAANIMDELEKRGIVGHSKGAEPRDILIPEAPEVPMDAPDATKSKPVKKPRAKKVLTKSKAALLKETLEARQTGTKLPEPKTKGKATVKEVLKAQASGKAKQPELPGVKVKMDKIGKCSRRFKDSLEALEQAQDEKGAAVKGLIKAMQKAKRYWFTIDGYHFEFIHKGPSDTVKVTKPK